MTVEPYFLKEFKRRWYLYGFKGDADGPHMMALDRMTRVKRELVKLKVYGTQVQYFRSLPLHSSQKEIETGDNHSVFTYFLTPDYDFKQDVLSFGDKVEVLEPKDLREEMRGIIKSLTIRYK